MIGGHAQHIPAVGPFLAGVIDNLPLTTIDIVVRVWGLKTASRADLSAIGYSVLNSRLADLNGINRRAFSTELSESHDVMGIFVEIRGRFIAALVSANDSTPAGVTPDLSGFFGQENVPGVTTYVVTNTGAGSTTNMTAPNDRGSRGTLMARLAAQQLSQQDSAPPLATANPQPASASRIA